MGDRLFRPHLEPEGIRVGAIPRDRGIAQGRPDQPDRRGRQRLAHPARGRRAARDHQANPGHPRRIAQAHPAALRKRRRFGDRCPPGRIARRNRAGLVRRSAPPPHAGRERPGAAAGRAAAAREHHRERQGSASPGAHARAAGRPAVGPDRRAPGHPCGRAATDRGQRQHRRGAGGVLPAGGVDDLDRHYQPRVLGSLRRGHQGLGLLAADQPADLRCRAQPGEPRSGSREPRDCGGAVRAIDTGRLPRRGGRIGRTRNLQRTAACLAGAGRRRIGSLPALGSSVSQRHRQRARPARRAALAFQHPADRRAGQVAAVAEPGRALQGARRRLGDALIGVPIIAG
ncbi:hypothetical protein VARIO8X_20134 [Burkholderiales bacterium 8X]|nr:hypothetical protein VARIO8X_20134 [Burkholderiales bacterium 8X]